jgi:hypothetical protein
MKTKHAVLPLLVLASIGFARGSALAQAAGTASTKGEPAAAATAPSPNVVPASSASADRAPQAFAAAPGVALPVLAVQEEPLTGYPSLDPAETVYVALNTPAAVFTAVGTASAQATWNCLAPATYTVQAKSASSQTHSIQVTAVLANGLDPNTGKLYTRCDAYGNLGGVNLVLGSRVDKTSTLTVTLYADTAHTKPLAQSNGKLTLSSADDFTYSASLQEAAGEALTDGASRTVGQASINLAESNLVHHAPFNLYLKSTDLFSTDERDTKSAFNLSFGGQRDLLRGWYTPLQLQETVQGNQIATNLSDVTSLSLSFIAPWAASKSLLNNNVIKAPLPPSLTFANLYTNRINQLTTKKSPALPVNDYAFNPSGSWSYITFPFTCKVIGWANKSAEASGSCLGATLDFGLFYLPLDLSKSGGQRAEGSGDASLLVPLSVLGPLAPFVTPNDPTKIQIQIKYSDMVSPTNNYARSRGWTFGLQANK